MAFNLTVQSSDFDKIKKESGTETANFLRRLWFILNDEIKIRRREDRRRSDRILGAVKTDAPTTAQPAYDPGDHLFLYFNGSTNWTLQGIRNGQEGRLLFLHNAGSATITIADDSGSASATNMRILTSTGANKSLTQDLAIVLQYLDSRWREAKIL